MEKLRRLCPKPIAEVGVEVAVRENISSGDVVKVETEFGSLEIEAKVVKGMHPLTVSIPHGWEDCNANELTGNLFDFSGAPVYRGLKCKVAKVRR